MAVTEWRAFLGLNIKGTPSMSGKRVAHDIRVAKRRSDVAVFQEFKWRWYWTKLTKLFRRSRKSARWRSFPSFATGKARPTFSAQPVLWKGKVWRRKASRRALLHKGVARVSETRHLRAVLLEDKSSGLACWFGTTHFVVGGDESSDSTLRRRMLREDLAAFDAFLSRLRLTGHPVIFQLDANIRKASAAYPQLVAVLDRHGARIIGEHGVEYLIVINGDVVKVQVKNAWVVPVSQLETDHEGRGLTFRLFSGPR